VEIFQTTYRTLNSEVGKRSILDFLWSGVKLPIWLPALLLPITWATDVRMTNARSFSISMLQDLSNDTKNTPMQGVLSLAVEVWTFGSLGELQVLNFGSVGLHPHTWPKWGCDNRPPPQTCYIWFQT
jgi:hypothetical protein